MQKTSPTFSIVIPTFNNRATVVETVRSALAQAYPHLEVVIDDNASKDGTVELLREIFRNEARLKIFANREDLNIPKGWNRAMKHATGDYRLLLHSDNLVHPRCVEVMMECLQKYPADVCYSECHYFEGDTPADLFEPTKSDQVGVTYLPPGKRAVDYVFRFQRMIPTSCVAIRASVFLHREPYSLQFRWDPDIELMTWLASNFRILHLQFPLAAIRTHDAQAASWKDPTFSKQYRSLLALANAAGNQEAHHFLMHWAFSNQDICEKLSSGKKVPWRVYFKYFQSWLVAETTLLGYFGLTYLKKVSLMSRYFRKRFNS